MHSICYCYKCGAEIPDESLFCFKCGADLSLQKDYQDDEAVDEAIVEVADEPDNEAVDEAVDEAADRDRRVIFRSQHICNSTAGVIQSISSDHSGGLYNEQYR